MMTLATLVLLCSHRSDFNATDSLASLRKFQQDAATELRAKGTPSQVDIAAYQQKVKDKVAEIVKDVKVSDVEPAQCNALGDIYSMGQMWPDALAATERFGSAASTPADKFNVDYKSVLFASYVPNVDSILSHTAKVQFPTGKDAVRFGSLWVGRALAPIADKKGVKESIAAADSLSARILATDGLEAADKKQVLIGFTSATAEMLAENNDAKGAISRIDKVLPGLETKEARSLTMLKTQLSLTGQHFPALTFTTGHGTFDQNAMTGKVVIIDFFAHWCGPCIASFPEMEAMYGDLHGKGLEVVGVTRYYGYYGAENRDKRDMAKDVEFAKMGDFIKQHKLPWAVMYGENDNFEKYGCAAIPYQVVIDKKGNVRKIKVGYDAQHFGEFRKFVEGLLAE